MTLYMHETGPLLRYEKGILYVEDLNPEIKTKWRMSRLEMIVLGWQCFRSALKRR